MYKVSDKVMNLITKTMENRKVELAAGGKKNLIGKNPKRNLPMRLTLTIAISYSNDATELFTLEMSRGLQIHKITGNHLMNMDIKIFVKKMKMNWKP